MRRELVLNEIFWNNAGSAALATLTSATIMWFPPNSAGTGTLTTTPSAAHWKALGLNGGVDELVIQGRTLLALEGGITAVASGNITLGVVAQAHGTADADFNTPHAIDALPSLFTSGAAAANQGNSLSYMVWGRDAGNVISAHDVVANTGGGLIANSTVSLNQRYGWTISVGRRANFAAQAGTVAPQEELTVSGLSKVWMSMSTIMTFTGTLLTTKLKAEIRVLGYKFVQDTASASSSSGVGLNIPAY